ncbi:PREDICTED: thioredoxin-related transmembrane protein 2 homolog isoform X2 [Rhagoletis zephyria]|uniref:thioredoxin-related transmembrane protein 2 homolog isoform X2 n=1 Tax=Rhagoletis zephyria TaxID=28612 RepID=UPI0008113328|nr:PREDICTED: thioredoxin-related transmembrane protein 2 homolog isoform X2 [Rhagoletis zephyria]XP_036340275.1 thioredoxin-related transmembrane protein 2 homolog isoform X2 [Rhagoletis pomonella]
MLRKQLHALLKPYYWINIILSVSYVVAKKLVPLCTRLFNHRGADMCELDGRETEILFFLLIVVMVRSRKTGSVTMVNYLSASFLYTKVANFILWAYSDFRTILQWSRTYNLLP